MGLFDKLTGTKRPDSNIPPGSVEEVRIALLGLSVPDVPYVIRDGSPEGVDLVAEWRMAEPVWRGLFVDSQLTRAVRIKMRLVPEDHEVRALDEQSEVKWVEGVPVALEYGRGPAQESSRHWSVGRGADGGLEATETFRFDSSELKDPLRDTVLKAGWTWRGVAFGKL